MRPTSCRSTLSCIRRLPKPSQVGGTVDGSPSSRQSMRIWPSSSFTSIFTRPSGRESAPYLAALVASSWNSSASGVAERPSISGLRAEEHTSELQSLMRISYAVFCLHKKTKSHHANNTLRQYEIQNHIVRQISTN